MNICVLRLHGETSAWSYLEVLLGPPPGWDREVFGMTEFRPRILALENGHGGDS